MIPINSAQWLPPGFAPFKMAKSKLDSWKCTHKLNLKM